MPILACPPARLFCMRRCLQIEHLPQLAPRIPRRPLARSLLPPKQTARETIMIGRRKFMAGAGAALLAPPAVARAEQTTVIKMGALKLIHSIAPYFYDKFTPAG